MKDEYSPERSLTAAESAITALLTGRFTYPCDFCREKENPNAPCSKVLGGTSRYCFDHAAWNGKGNAEP